MTSLALPYNMHESDNANDWATTVATQLARAIKSSTKNSDALLLVSGGSTPGPIFDELSQLDLPWNKVVISLVDERWVPETHEWSNTALVRQRLLQHHASKARWQPITTGDASPQEGVEQLNIAFAPLFQLPRIMLLGMGSDSHTASLFPHMINHAAMDRNATGLFPVDSTGSPQCPRITIGLGTLTTSDHLILAISGAEKKSVFEQSTGSDTQTPIGLAIHYAQHPINVFWRP